MYLSHLTWIYRKGTTREQGRDGAVVRALASHQCGLGSIPAWGLFLEGPEKFWYPTGRIKISNLMITKLFCSHVLIMNRGSLNARSFRRIHLFVSWCRLIKNCFAGPEGFRGFRETGPRCHRYVEFVVDSRLAPRIFLPVLRFSFLHKTNLSKFQFDPDRRPAWTNYCCCGFLSNYWFFFFLFCNLLKQLCCSVLSQLFCTIDQRTTIYEVSYVFIRSSEKQY